MDVLNDFSAESLIAVNKANLFSFFEYLGTSTAPSVEFQDGTEFRWMLTGLGIAFLNNVMRTRLPSDQIDERIQQTIAHFRANNSPMFTWWVEPDSQPENLGERLAANGLVYSPGAPGMAADLQALNTDFPTPAGVTIRPVTDATALRDWVNAGLIGFGDVTVSQGDPCFAMFMALGFDLPLRNYVAYLDDKPVAASQLFLGAGVAGLYWVATVAEARGRGIGGAISLRPMLDARDMGYRIGILQASEMGAPVYKRMGFQEYVRLSNYYMG